MAAGVLERHASVDGSSAGPAHSLPPGIGPTSLDGMVVVEQARVIPDSRCRRPPSPARSSPAAAAPRRAPPAQRPPPRRDLGLSMGMLGGNLCNGESASDPSPALLALRAGVRLRGPGGKREVPVTEFFTGFYETALQERETLAAVDVPPMPAGTR